MADTEIQDKMQRADPVPTSQSERIIALDVLRGFALLGILVMNIQSFSMVGAAYLNPTAFGNLEGANLWVWLLSHLLADQKFMTIFSMLFGAGVALMTSRAESRDRPAAKLHYRRMGWLIVFGLAHGYLLWYGDVLFLYGVCGLLVYSFRKLPPRRLILIGLLSLAISSVFYLSVGLSMTHWPQDTVEEFRSSSWRPNPEMVAKETAAYRGGWLDQMTVRFPGVFFFQTFVLLIWGLWRAGGLMLIGMALFKLGVFSAERSASFYRRMLVAGVFVGLPVVAHGVYRNFEANWDVAYSFFLGSQFNYWGSVAVSLGWVGLVMLVVRSSALTALTRRLAAVGQTALSNYVLHTIVCTTLFYGHGFGLFGQIERVGQIAIVAAVWVIQLLLTPLWLKRFRFGPLEWLWRSLAYKAKQPLRRAPLALTG